MKRISGIPATSPLSNSSVLNSTNRSKSGGKATYMITNAVPKTYFMPSNQKDESACLCLALDKHKKQTRELI